MTHPAGGIETPEIEISGFSKTFPGQRALEGVDMKLFAGEIHALVGENGSGKSTLIKCLSGYHTPDHGAMLKVRGQPVRLPYGAREAASHGLVFVHQDFGIVPSLTVMENIALGTGFATRRGSIQWREQAKIARRELGRLGHGDIPPELEARHLSASMQAIVAIARSLAAAESGARLIVLDEPTAALPEAEVTTLFEVVRRLAVMGATVLFVSHRLSEVFDLATHVTVLRDARKVGSYDVKELDERRLVELIVGRDLPNLYPDSTSAPRRDVVLRVKGLVGNRLNGVDFEAHRGEILGIAGLQGSGRSELMRTLFGAQQPAGGVIELDGRPVRFASSRSAIDAGMALVPEDRLHFGALGHLTVAENLSLPTVGRYFRRGWLQRRGERARVRQLIDEFHVQPPDPDRLMCRLSGGNQQKAILAKWIETGPTVLLLDEPVQGVDVGSKTEIWALIEHLVATRGTTVLVTSSDFDDLQGICHRVLVLRDGRIVADLADGRKTVECMIEHAYLTGAAA